MIPQLSGIYRLSAAAVLGLAVGFLVVAIALCFDVAMPSAGCAYDLYFDGRSLFVLVGDGYGWLRLRVG